MTHPRPRAARYGGFGGMSTFKFDEVASMLLGEALTLGVDVVSVLRREVQLAKDRTCALSTEIILNPDERILVEADVSRFSAHVCDRESESEKWVIEDPDHALAFAEALASWARSVKAVRQ